LSDYEYYRTELGVLYCGDCLEILPLINKVEVIITDIPYNISQKSSGLRKLDYGEWDKQYGKEKKWVISMISKFTNSIYIFCGKKQFSKIIDIYDNNNIMNRTLIWKKPNPTVLNCDKLYIEATELIAYGKKKNGIFNSRYRHNIFNYTSPINRQHPTQKPINLIIEFIRDSTDNGLILDPFLGSGTTAVACEKLNRRWIGIEISEKYCEIAKQRIKNEYDKLKLMEVNQ